MNEASLSKFIYNYAKKMGCMCVKIDASHKGWPDRLILKNKNIMFIEVKNPNGKGRLSKMQEYIINKISENGINVFVVSDKNIAINVINKFVKGELNEINKIR